MVCRAILWPLKNGEHEPYKCTYYSRQNYTASTWELEHYSTKRVNKYGVRVVACWTAAVIAETERAEWAWPVTVDHQRSMLGT